MLLFLFSSYATVLYPRQFAHSVTVQSRSFSVVGPTTWNNRVTLDLKHLPNGACSQFHQLLKTVVFPLVSVHLGTVLSCYYTLSLIPFTLPPGRAGPSPWLALWYEMVSHWLSGHFQGYSPRNSFSNLKQHYLAVLGLASE